MAAPITINARISPSGMMGRKQVCSRPASACGSVRSVRSGGSLAVPVCMKAVVRTSSNMCNEARPDCCRIPACKPPLPKCPLGIFVERTQPIRPDRNYEPPTIPFEGLSSYREHYHLKCANKTLAFKPDTHPFDPSQAKMDGLSSYREAYTPKPTMAYQKPPWSIKARFEPSTSKMEGASTYRVDYTGCMGEKVSSMKPEVAVFDPSIAKMDGITTYRTCFIPYCSREYKYAKQPQTMKQVNPTFSCAPMEGQSTYRSDYWPKCSGKRQSMKPNIKRGGFSDAAFADRTTYRNDYNPFHFDRCVGQCIPAEVYDQTFPDDRLFACGDSEGQIVPPYEDPCPPGPGCCEGGMRGSCGNEMGIFPGPLPECCDRDPVPVFEEADC